MASQSNLFAAIAWTIVNVVSNPDARSKVLEEIREIREEFGDNWLSNPKVRKQKGGTDFDILRVLLGNNRFQFFGAMLPRVDSNCSAKLDLASGDEADFDRAVYSRPWILYCYIVVLSESAGSPLNFCVQV